MEKRQDLNKSSFMEKNRIYRMLSMAMVEDGKVSDGEMQIMIAVLLRRSIVDQDIEGDFKDYAEEYHKIFWEDKNNNFFPDSLYKLHYHYTEKGTDKDTDIYVGYKKKDDTSKKTTDIEVSINNATIKMLVWELIEMGCRDINSKQCLELLDFELPSNIGCDLIHTILEKRELDKQDIKKDERVSDENLEKAFEILKKILNDDKNNTIKKLVALIVKTCILAHKVLKKCEGELKHDESPASRSQFAAIDQLKQAEKTQELIDLYAIICSDKVIVDCEREAFRIICRLFKFQHSSLILQEVVDCYEKYNKEEVLLKIDPKKDPFDIIEKQNYDVGDYAYIKEAIIKYDIQGPLKYGVYQIFTRDIMQHDEKTRKFDRKWSNIAITIFAITALILYAFVSDLLHNSLEHSQNKDTETIEVHQESNINSLIFEYDNWRLKNLLSPMKNKQVIIITIGLLTFLGCFIRVVIPTWYEKGKYRRLKHKILNYPLHPNGKIWLRLILGVSLMLLTCLTFSVEFEIWLKTLFIPMVLLLMMLSIEWLIFMKSEIKDTDPDDDKTKSKQTDNTPLYVLTFVAILLDMGLGAVEWLLDNEINDSYKILLAKLSSAIVLGAICYFSGKFLEMHRAQQKQDRETMDKCVEEIKNGKKS